MFEIIVSLVWLLIVGRLWFLIVKMEVKIDYLEEKTEVLADFCRKLNGVDS